jgi:hypothetical protein
VTRQLIQEFEGWKSEFQLRTTGCSCFNKSTAEAFRCVCVCMYLYVCVYICMYVYYARMFVFLYVCMYVCTYVRMYVCMYVRAYVCMCMYVCMFVYVCMCVCTYVCIFYVFIEHAPLLSVVLHAVSIIYTCFTFFVWSYCSLLNNHSVAVFQIILIQQTRWTPYGTYLQSLVYLLVRFLFALLGFLVDCWCLHNGTEYDT